MKCRDLYKSANISLPKGIYFYGVEIKSHALVLVKALATELGKEFGDGKKPLRIFRRMASDVVSKYSTDKSAYSFVDRLFSVATKNKPSIIFMEDLDKFGGFCQYNIMTNHDLVTKLGTCMDALVPGEVFVIATITSMTNTFAPLNSGKRFTKFLSFPSSLSVNGILGCLKMETEKWQISTTTENSREEILVKVSELLSTSGLSLKCDDITTLCQEIYQTAINDQIQSSRPPVADCCSCCKCPPTAPEFPTLPQWEAGLKAFTKMKKVTAAPARPGENSDFTAATARSDSSMDSLSFTKIGGLAAQIQILTENIITPLKNRDKLKELGWDVEPVRGFIFHGPPGTGKTLLGKTLAAELSRLNESGNGKKFSFFYHKGTDCYTKWVGDTEAKLRSIFANAEAKKPAIIFMDEIDGLCSARDENASISKFYNGVVTTMLGLMDNLPRGEVFVIAATNRLTCLDPALRRPGRFDKTIEFQAPKLEGRKSILEIHTASWDAKSKMEATFVDEIAEMTGGYTGADLEQVCRQAFVFAMRRHSSTQNSPKTENVPKNKESETGSDFDGLIVQRQDWYSALKSVRPSGTNHFGNAVITDKPIPNGAAAALKEKLDEITGRLGYFLKPEDATVVGASSSSKCGGGLNTFLIWGSDAKQLKVIDNLLIPALFSSPAFSPTLAAKFEIPPLGVGQEVIQRHVSSTFNHVLNPGEGKFGILYVPGIDQLLHARIGKFWKMKEHEQILDSFEMLRGERVLLIGTATGSPDQMSDRVQVLFRGLQNSRHYELPAPNVTEIRQVFSNISAKIQPATFEKMITKLGGATPQNTADLVGNTVTRKNLTLYDLLDFEGEVAQIFTQYDSKSDKDKTDEEINTALEKATEAFCSYLDGQEKYKSSLSSMYT
ncbi:ATPase family AAA domain-containing protein At1g05910 [Folsomia candida]|uniref:ATPase family AAA domain-containing protein At1g05910 n=1 Tax=Folsomia candida TaxID=158441 RepID=UPI000B8F7728|nr:ATPase family AAA domain-containing protein At1g05910 [Folsomia candida]